MGRLCNGRIGGELGQSGKVGEEGLGCCGGGEGRGRDWRVVGVASWMFLGILVLSRYCIYHLFS